jgi:hypothetical protein
LGFCETLFDHVRLSFQNLEERLVSISPEALDDHAENVKREKIFLPTLISVLSKHSRDLCQQVPSNKRVSAIKPGFYSLHEKEIGHRKKGNRTQQ